MAMLSSQSIRYIRSWIADFESSILIVGSTPVVEDAIRFLRSIARSRTISHVTAMQLAVFAVEQAGGINDEIAAEYRSVLEELLRKFDGLEIFVDEGGVGAVIAI